jgi:integrase
MSYFNTSDNSHLSDLKLIDEEGSLNPQGREINLTVRSSQNVDEDSFSSLVRTYVQNAVADNTRRAYRSDLTHFEAWGGTIPCDQEMIARYLVAHAGKLAIATLKRRLAAISVTHEVKSHPTPTTGKLVKATLRGLQRAHGAPQKQSSPLLVEDLLSILGMLNDSVKDMRDKALLLIGFAGGFRRSELVSLDIKDISYVRQGLLITINRSKTDQLGIGRQIGIPFARGRHCPVQSLKKWLSVLDDDSGSIFRPVTRHERISPARLSKDAVSRIVKARAQAIGLEPESYSGHSLRAGLATSAAMRGVSTLAIKSQTGHRSDAMVARYVRHGELFVNNAVSTLL